LLGIGSAVSGAGDEEETTPVVELAAGFIEGEPGVRGAAD